MSEGYETPSAPRRTEFDPTYDATYTEVPVSGATTYGSTPSAPSTSSSQGGSDSTTGVAADQAKQVGQDALDSGKQVAGVAADQAKSVASEAGTQAKNLLGEARTQLTDQAATQQNNLSSWLTSIVDELEGMANGTRDPAQSGPASSLVTQVSDRAKTAATWLEDHEPADLLAATSRFARQRPGLFLALAGLGGVVAGRLTRGLTADAASQGSTGGGNGGQNGHSHPTTPVAPLTTTAAPGPYTTAAPQTAYAEGTGFAAVPGDDLLYDDDLDEARRSGFEGGTGTDRDFR